MTLNPAPHSPAIPYICISNAAGIGPEAEALRVQISNIYEGWGATLTLGDVKRELKNQLIEVFEECSELNWDGYGADPVKFDTYCKAEEVLFSLPVATPSPHISASPKGEIVFEWRNREERGLVASVSATGEISYAGIFGSCSRVRGVEVFNGKVPQTILENLQRLFAQI